MVGSISVLVSALGGGEGAAALLAVVEQRARLVQVEHEADAGHALSSAAWKTAAAASAWQSSTWGL